MGRHSAVAPGPMEHLLIADGATEDDIPTEPIWRKPRTDSLPAVMILMGLFLGGLLTLWLMKRWPSKLDIFSALLLIAIVTVPALSAVAATLVMNHRAARRYWNGE